MAIDKQKIWTQTKRISILLLWIILLCGVVVSLAFVNKQDDQITCKQIDISITPKNELLFIDREMVLSIIHPEGLEHKILGKKITDLNVSIIEQKLNHNDFVQSAQVYTDMNGNMKISVNQRRPILRILKADGSSFYLDEHSLKMPISQAFTAHVPVATGNIYEAYKTRDSMHSQVGVELNKIATYVDKEAFWKAQIEQIFVTVESEFVLVPKVGNHTILLGTAENMEAKFEKLMVFYKEGLPRVGWDKYTTINLKFKDQIVCTKK
jgi:cell division protein FtsQ